MVDSLLLLYGSSVELHCCCTGLGDEGKDEKAAGEHNGVVDRGG